MPTRWTNVNLLYLSDNIGIVSLEELTLMVAENQPIKAAIFMVMHDFHGLKTMTLNCVADIAYL